MDKKYMDKLVDMFKKGKIIVDEKGNLALSESYLQKTRKIKGVKKEEKSKTYSKEGVKLSEKLYLAQLKSGELKIRGGRKNAQKFNEELKVKTTSKRIGEERREVYKVLSGMIDRYVESLEQKSGQKSSKQKVQEQKIKEENSKQKVLDEKMMEVSRRSGVDFETVKEITLNINDRMRKANGKITFEEAFADLIYEKKVAFNEATSEEEKFEISSEIIGIEKTLFEVNVDSNKIDELVKAKEIKDIFKKRNDDNTKVETEGNEQTTEKEDIAKKIFREIPYSHEEKVKYFKKYYDMLNKWQKYELKLLYLENSGLISRIRAKMPWKILDKKLVEKMEFRYDIKYTLAKFIEINQMDNDMPIEMTNEQQRIKKFAKEKRKQLLKRIDVRENVQGTISTKSLHKKAKIVAIGSQEK